MRNRQGKMPGPGAAKHSRPEHEETTTVSVTGDTLTVNVNLTITRGTERIGRVQLEPIRLPVKRGEDLPIRVLAEHVARSALKGGAR